MKKISDDLNEMQSKFKDELKAINDKHDNYMLKLDNDFKQKLKEIEDKEASRKKDSEEKSKKYKKNIIIDENKIKEVENKIVEQLKKNVENVDKEIKEEDNKVENINKENEEFLKKIDEESDKYRKANNITDKNFDFAPPIKDENNISHQQVMKLLNDSSLIIKKINDQFHYFIMSLQNFSSDIKMANLNVENIYLYIENQIQIPDKYKNELKDYINRINNNSTKYNEFKESFDYLKKDIELLKVMDLNLKKVEHLDHKESDFLKQYNNLIECNNEHLILKSQYNQNIENLKYFVDLGN